MGEEGPPTRNRGAHGKACGQGPEVPSRARRQVLRSLAMATVQHWWATYSPYQAVGTTEWEWDTVGEGDHYWSFSLRPKQANMLVEVEREWATTNNDMNA